MNGRKSPEIPAVGRPAVCKHGRSRPASGRIVAALSTVVLAVVSGSTPAWAHEGETAVAAVDDVRQAIAVIVNKPGDMGTVEDKIGDALESEDTEGVDLALVKQARDALESEDMAKVRALLEAAIGARPDLSGTDVRPILHVPLATGEETGTRVVTDELPGRAGLTRTDVLLVVLSGLLAVAGLALSRRWRPADSVADLRRRAAPSGDRR